MGRPWETAGRPVNVCFCSTKGGINMLTAPVEVRRCQRFWKWAIVTLFSSSCETPWSNSVVVLFTKLSYDPIGSSQELTLRATIAISGSVSSRQLLFHDVPCAFNFLEERERERVRGMYDFRTMLQRIRNVLEVTWRRCYNVSGTSWKLLEEYVTTYQECLANYWKKMLQRVRNLLQVT